jgi:hypothetical protein
MEYLNVLTLMSSITLACKDQTESLHFLSRFGLSPANEDKESLFASNILGILPQPIKCTDGCHVTCLLSPIWTAPFSGAADSKLTSSHCLLHPPPVLGFFFPSSSACPHFRERLLAETLTGSTRLDKLRRDFCSTFDTRKRRSVKCFLRLGVTPSNPEGSTCER